MTQRYKHTEVGVIPEDWEDVLLDRVARRGSGHTPDKRHPEYWNGGIKWVSLADSPTLDRLYLDDTYATISAQGLANSSAVLHPAGTVILSRDAGVGKSTIMRTAMAVSQHFMAWRCGAELDNHFLYYWLQAAKPQFERIADGSTIKTIGVPYFKGLRIARPPLVEQRAIASALSDVDALLDELDLLIFKTRNLRQGVMQQLLTGKTRLPGFLGDWQTRPLSFAVEDLKAGVSVNSLANGAGSDTGLDNDPHVPRILKTSAVEDGAFFPTESKRIASRDLSRARTSPRRDTIIISRMNTPDLVGECGYVPEDYPNLFLPDRLWMALLAPGTNASPRWLAYMLSAPPLKTRIKALATGTSGSMKNISRNTLLSLLVPFPEGSEQAAIAEVLNDMQAELVALTKRRDKTRDLKQAMIQELLTGRMRLA